MQGAGLGLTIALAIVEAHAGTIEVLRSTPEGTTFRMTFPLRSPAAEPSEQPVARVVHAAQGVVVDDARRRCRGRWPARGPAA